MMESKYGSRRKTSSGRGLILAALFSFTIGGLLIGYIVWYNMRPDAVPGSGEAAPVTADGTSAPAPTPSALPSAATSPSPTPLAALGGAQDDESEVDAVTRVAVQQGGIEQRLVAAEQRLARLDLQAQAAAGNAARAESLLIAFATRRAIERGAELGYLADQLRLRFGDQWPNAVSTIIDFSRKPIRLDSLTARLEGLGPQLSESDQGPSWATFRQELSELFIFRRESTPSPQPERRLRRARYALEQGRYQNAIDEVRNMPGARKAESWIADAERYRDAMRALETIETAAVLDQRGLRDGAGNPVQQPSAVRGADDN